jgi:pimeloyl-ACP methyl ester carboxylesterase
MSVMTTTTRRNFLELASVGAAAAAFCPRRAARAATPPRAAARSAPIDLFVKDWGAGRPVIFAHGWPLNADSWDFHAMAVAQAGYRAISYDRRGFGRSRQTFDGYDFDTFADDLARLIESRNLRDVTLVGFSMGGSEVLHYLARHGQKRVAKLVLVGAATPFLLKTGDNPHGIDGAALEGFKDAIRKDRPKFMAGLFKDAFYDVSAAATTPVSPEVLAWSSQMALTAGLPATIGCVDALMKADLRPELAAVGVPTLVLHGTADKPVPIGLARATAAGIKGARLVEIPGASHGLLVTERDRVLAELMQQLR